MRTRTLLAMALAGGCLGLLAAAPLTATEKIGQDERMACTDCHRGKRAKRLNDLGMYYEVTRTVEGFDELNERFSRCTTCHRRRAGSKDLTATGRKYRWFFEDMEGIREWVMEQHPKVDEPAAARSEQGVRACRQ